MFEETMADVSRGLSCVDPIIIPPFFLASPPETLVCYRYGQKKILKWFNLYEKKVVYDVVLEAPNYMDIQDAGARDFD